MPESKTDRPDGRRADQMRPIRFVLDYVEYPEGSVLVEVGRTRVLCNVSLTEGLPAWRAASGGAGWLTAEYALLPRSTHTRTPRETQGLSGRTQEVRRLIGRSLRAALALELLGERTLVVDCDVLQADGGTRTAAITGGYVAVALALRRLVEAGAAPAGVVRSPVAAVSAGVVDGQVRIDLCYAEDRCADVDLTVVMAEGGRLVEVQGSAEGATFSRERLDDMLDLAARAIGEMMRRQREALA